MLLIGSFDWASTVETGSFLCPNCKGQQGFRRRSTRTFLTLYFIPVIPMSAIREHIECLKCRRPFPVGAILNTDTSGKSEGPIAQFDQDVIIAMAAIMCDDGTIDRSEIDAALFAYPRLCRQDLSESSLAKYCAWVQQSRLSSMTFLMQGASRWSIEERFVIVQAMFYVASATGELSARRNQTLLKAQQVFEMTEAEFQQTV